MIGITDPPHTEAEKPGSGSEQEFWLLCLVEGVERLLKVRWRREQVQSILCLEIKNILNSNGRLIRIIVEAHSLTFFNDAYRVKIQKEEQMIILLLPGQKIHKRATAINTEIPVREYDGNTSEEFFRINDFEFFEERRNR